MISGITFPNTRKSSVPIFISPKLFSVMNMISITIHVLCSHLCFQLSADNFQEHDSRNIHLGYQRTQEQCYQWLQHSILLFLLRLLQKKIEFGYDNTFAHIQLIPEKKFRCRVRLPKPRRQLANLLNNVDFVANCRFSLLSFWILF